MEFDLKYLSIKPSVDHKLVNSQYKEAFKKHTQKNLTIVKLKGGRGGIYQTFCGYFFGRLP